MRPLIILPGRSRETRLDARINRQGYVRRQRGLAASPGFRKKRRPGPARWPGGGQGDQRINPVGVRGGTRKRRIWLEQYMRHQSCLVGMGIAGVDDGNLQRAPVGAEPQLRAIFGEGLPRMRDRLVRGGCRGEFGVASLDFGSTIAASKAFFSTAPTGASGRDLRVRCCWAGLHRSRCAAPRPRVRPLGPWDRRTHR